MNTTGSNDSDQQRGTKLAEELIEKSSDLRKLLLKHMPDKEKNKLAQLSKSKSDSCVSHDSKHV